MERKIVKNIISVYDNGNANINEMFRSGIELSNSHAKDTGKYWVIGETIANREAILPMVDRSGSRYVAIFDDYNEGNVKFSDIAYGLAVRDVTMIFLTGKTREPGNALLEALVNVGQYNIVRSNQYTPEVIADNLERPKKFADVSPMTRKMVTADSEDERIFDLPELSKLRLYSDRLSADFLKSDYDPEKVGQDHVTAKDPKSLTDIFSSGTKKVTVAKTSKKAQPKEPDDLDDPTDALDL